MESKMLEQMIQALVGKVDTEPTIRAYDPRKGDYALDTPRPDPQALGEMIRQIITMGQSVRPGLAGMPYQPQAWASGSKVDEGMRALIGKWLELNGGMNQPGRTVITSPVTREPHIFSESRGAALKPYTPQEPVSEITKKVWEKAPGRGVPVNATYPIFRWNDTGGRVGPLPFRGSGPQFLEGSQVLQDLLTISARPYAR